MDPDELRASYDKVADTYAERNRDPGLVLDVGCGPGHIARHLSERAVEVAGVDLSPEMIEVARRLNPGLRFDVGDMTALDVEDVALAGIIAFYSIIHIPRKGVSGVLREFRRVIRSGGELVLAVHGGTGSVRRDEFLGQPVPFEATLFERDELVSLVEGAGFRLGEAIQRAPSDDEAQTQRLYLRALVP